MSANKWPHHQGGRSKDPEKVKFAFELAAAGNTRRQIAEYFGVSRATIDNWMAAPRVKVEPEPKTSERPAVERTIDGKVFVLALLKGGGGRRFDCRLLSHCELVFIEKYGSAQGTCPKDCPGPG